MRIPTYREVHQASEDVRLKQAPLRRKFEKCTSLALLTKLLSEEPSIDAPWLGWICAGPPAKPGRGFDFSERRWTRTRKAGDTLCSLIETLIAKGADLSIEDGERHGPTQLATLIGFGELTPAQRVKLLKLVASKGADPAFRTHQPMFAVEDGPCIGISYGASALDAAVSAEREHPEFVAALKQVVDSEDLEDAYAHCLIWRLHSRSVSDLEQLATNAGDFGTVTKLESTNTGALIHFLVQPQVSMQTFEHFLGRVTDVNQPLPQPFPFTLSVEVKVGLIPQLQLEPGATALDMLDAVIGFVKKCETVAANGRDSDFRPDDAKEVLERCEAKRAVLSARGAVSKKPFAKSLAPQLAATVEQLARLARLLGNDDAMIRARVEALDTSQFGPWGLMSEVIPVCASSLLSPRLRAAPLLGHTIGAFVDEGPDEVAEFIGAEWSKQLRRTELPKARRGDVETAVVFHEEIDADLRYLVVKTTQGSEVWKLQSSEVEPIAASVPDFLTQQIDEFVAAERA